LGAGLFPATVAWFKMTRGLFSSGPTLRCIRERNVAVINPQSLANLLRCLAGLRMAPLVVEGVWVMTENTQQQADRRNRLLEAATQEMIKFEQKENEFRRRDRQERAAELRLPLDKINVH